MGCFVVTRDQHDHTYACLRLPTLGVGCWVPLVQLQASLQASSARIWAVFKRCVSHQQSFPAGRRDMWQLTQIEHRVAHLQRRNEKPLLYMGYFFLWGSRPHAVVGWSWS